MIKELYQWLQAHQTEMLAGLEQLVNLESPSDRKDLLDLFSVEIARKFSEAGASVEVLPQTTSGNHVKVTYGSGTEQILLLCHFDTVFSAGEVAKRPFRYDAATGIAKGPGVLDMKAGILSALWLLHAYKDLQIQPKAKIVVLLNSDEEVGSRTSRPFIEAEAKKSKAIFVLEPGTGPQGDYKVWRKGTGAFNLKVIGKASHAGTSPEEGISAIQELALQIEKIHSYTNFTTGTTLNVGVIGGGTRSNVVAEEAWAKIDMRVMTIAEGERVTQEILSLKPVGKAKLEISGGLNRPPMERSVAAMAYYDKAAALAEEIGLHYNAGGTGGGSDGNFTAALGIPTLDGMGGVGHGAHSSDEYLIAKHLSDRTAILAELIRTIE